MPIEVTEHGIRKKISKRHAIVKQTVNKALAGDPKATSILLAEARLHDNQNQPVVARRALVCAEDEMVMDNIVHRILRSKAPSSDCETRPESVTVNQADNNISPLKEGTNAEP